MAERTRTGGRAATSGVIGGGIALAVGNPRTPLPEGFSWQALDGLARLESGHTPSRRIVEYWDGDIPWIGIRDATENHGRTIFDTKQHISQAGVANSSTRLLPANTVCLSRTASVGYVVTMGVPMCTSQDFVNWVCGPRLNHRYLALLLRLEQETVRRFASGTTHQTVYFPEAKAFHIAAPGIIGQRAIVAVLGALDDKIESNRRANDVALALLDAMSLSVGLDRSSVPLSVVAEPVRDAFDPVALNATLIDHFSIPAFDATGLPHRTEGASVISAKLRVGQPSILVSRLNPKTNRTWFAVPEPGVTAGCSTEFLVLKPRAGVTLGSLWLAVRGEGYRSGLAQRVTGTSGSHQRVKPQDALDTDVPDVRQLSKADTSAADELLWLVHQRRVEIRKLAELRDALLPELLSGRIEMREASEDIDQALA